MTILTAQPDTAVFYSINNTQNGLAGLGPRQGACFFRWLIFLRREEPGIRTFCTLSPMPRFFGGDI